MTYTYIQSDTSFVTSSFFSEKINLSITEWIDVCFPRKVVNVPWIIDNYQRVRLPKVLFQVNLNVCSGVCSISHHLV